MTFATFRIDGRAFDDLEGFYDEIERQLLAGAAFGRNLDALNDILRGEVGRLPAAFALTWANADLSRQRLGHAEAARQLERRLARCHPSHRDAVRAELATARRGEGPTVFDWLLEIIRAHSNVKLILT